MSLTKRLSQAFLNLVACTALIFGAAALISKGAKHIDIYPQEKIFLVASLSIAFLGGFLGFGLRSGIKEDVNQRKLVWWTGVIVFLYLATAMLCQRLQVGTLEGIIWRNFGLALFLLGGFIRLWAITTLGHLHSGYVTIQEKHSLVESGPYRFLHLRHPSYSGILLMIIGMPLIFGAWFPLLGVPGIFVTLKWRINAEEALLSEHFGEKYHRFKQGKWKIIPFIY